MWQTAKHIKQHKSFFPGAVGDGERNFMAADIMATAIMAPLTVASGRCFQTIYLSDSGKGVERTKTSILHGNKEAFGDRNHVRRYMA